jgi:phage gp37-like protein
MRTDLHVAMGLRQMAWLGVTEEIQTDRQVRQLIARVMIIVVTLVLCIYRVYLKCLDMVFAVLGRYAAQTGRYWPTYRDHLSVQSSTVKQSSKMEPIGCTETSVTINLHCVTYQNNEDVIETAVGAWSKTCVDRLKEEFLTRRNKRVPGSGWFVNVTSGLQSTVVIP